MLMGVAPVVVAGSLFVESAYILSADADPKLEVVLHSAKPQYVAGEPVVLDLTLRNGGARPVPVLVEAVDYSIDVYLAQEGKPWERWCRGLVKLVTIMPSPMRPLPPGECKRYSFRILQTWYRSGTGELLPRLAFPTPGVYRAKAWYPVGESGTVLESSTVEFRVSQRQRIDVKVWDEINEQTFLQFLESGRVQRDHRDVVQKAIDVVRRWPKSSYDGAIRWALEQHFRERTRGFGKRGVPSDIKLDPELEAICGVLGIRRVPSGPYPEDKRLDAWISYAFPEKTPFEHAFEVISTLSGVPLRVHPELRHRSMVSLPQTTTLRTFMARCGENVVWVRDGNGYKLVPAAVQEPEPQAKKE